MSLLLKKTVMIKRGLTLFITFGCWCVSSWAQEVPDAKDAIVKIYTIYRQFNYSMPWQMKGQKSRNGSGCIIQGKRILTNAHIVSDHAFIQVRRAGQTKKYTAKVETIAHECDLAILKVEDQTFFSGADSISLGDLPKIRDKVYVCGFPVGGDKLSVTEGVVSRIEHSVYAHSMAYLLACQIDAAINPGNSGGPVIKENRLVGVAFQAVGSMENVGYMVPTPVIKHFLKDIEDGKYDGIPGLGVFCQKMENPDIREYFGIMEDQVGILVDKVYQNSPVREWVKPDDIILSVDGYKVGNDGTIEFRRGYRTFFEYVIQRHQINDILSLEIMREKHPIIKLRCPLTERINSWRLVPPEHYDIGPTYYILGGLVFEPLTLNYLKEWGRNWADDAPLDLVRHYLKGEKSEEQNEVIVLVNVLADEMNSGYQDKKNEIIHSVNGIAIRSMRDLVRAFEENKGSYHIIEDKDAYQIILNKSKVETYGPRILQRYLIRSDRSSDLRP